MVFRKRLNRADSKLADNIRKSFLLLLLPNIIFMIYSFYNLWQINSRYDAMLNSVVAASEFSLDFKEDFDYETYLLIVGNVTFEDSSIPTLLSQATEIVGALEDYTYAQENRERIRSTLKYLNNLETYVNRIKDNLGQPNKYDDNLLIWENDVQIVTSLIQETVNQYIFYENKQLQTVQERNRTLFLRTFVISIVFFVIIIVSVIAFSIYGSEWITKPVEEQVKKEQKQLRKAEFELLQAQINPHFLYNTLDAIEESAQNGEEGQVVSMVHSLSDFFRFSLSKGKDIVSVREELQHVKSYLEIQQIRYKDILTYELNVTKDIYDYSIPKITIQPLVENALYHGIKNRRGGGRIIITGVENKNDIVIQIRDNGIGMDAERLNEVRQALSDNSSPVKSVVYGLYNVNERIRLNFGDDYGVKITSEFGEGTTVLVRLPKIPISSRFIAVKGEDYR